MSQIVEMKTVTGIGKEFMELEPDFAQNSFVRTREKPSYWSQLGSNEQQEKGKAIIQDMVNEVSASAFRPLAGYGLPPPPRGNFVDHIFLEALRLARVLQHVSPLTMAALSCNSLLHTLPYKIFDN